MKRLLALAVGGSLLVFLAGCAAGRAAAGSAVVVLADEALAAPPAGEPGRKGEACVTNVLNLVSVWDGSVRRAMKDGNITKVSSVDREMLGINLWWVRFGWTCTVVRGQ